MPHLVILAMLLIIGTVPGHAEQGQQPPLPNPGRNETEQWVWEEVRAGRIADLHKHCEDPTNRGDGALDPRDKDDQRWHDPCRAISVAFLERVLVEEPWRSSLPFRGFRIIGARIANPLDLSAAHIAAEVWIVASRFEGMVRLRRTRAAGMLLFGGSTFEAGLDGSSLQVGGWLVLRGATVRGGPLRLDSARIDGELNANDSVLEAGLDGLGLKVGANLFVSHATVRGGPLELQGAEVKGLMALRDSSFDAGLLGNDLQVGGNLVMGNVTVRGRALELPGAEVKGYLDARESTFEAGLRGDGLKVGGTLFLSNVTVRGGPLNLAGAEVKGDLGAGGATLETGLYGLGLKVGRNLVLNNTTFAEAPRISFAQVQGVLTLGEAKLPGLDLSGSSMGELRLGSMHLAPPQWTSDAVLNLSGAQTKVLQDHLAADKDVCSGSDAWPSKLNLQGFVYGQLGADRGHDMRARDACWYVNWLKRDDQFARQPYQHLAGVLRAAGETDRAQAVLYAARDRELDEAWRKGDRLHAAGLWLLKATIGFGIGDGVFRVFIWVLGFTMLGALVLWFSPHARGKGLPWCLGASLDHLLPIVELNKEFGDFFDDPQRTRLNGWQVGYFAVHTLVGYLLGLFVVAALAGLTQAA